LTNQLENVLQSIISDQTRRRFNVEDPFTFNIVNENKDRSSTNLNGEFMFSRLFVDTLLRMNFNQLDRKEFIDLCKIQYQLNPSENGILHEFELDYSSDQALKWYTKESFLYRLLNKALRVRNIDLLFLIRFFINDLQVQLEKLKSSKPLRVFRAQLMSLEEFQVFQQSIGQYISMNSFISTSLNRDLALFYLGNSVLDNENSPKRLLFEINADPSIECIKPFANISELSNFPEEEEVLFMLGSVFRLDAIVFEPDKKIWIIEMTMCSDNEHQAKDVYEKMRNELCGSGNETPNLIHLGNVLYDMGQFEKAEKYFRRLLNKLPNEHSDKANCIHKLGLAVNAQGDHEGGLELLHKGLQIRLETLPPGDELLGNSYNSIGLVYEDKYDYQSAIEWYKKGLIIYKNLYGEEHPRVALSLNNIGMMYEKQGKREQALECHFKALTIKEKFLPGNHPQTANSLHNIGEVYRNLDQYDKAREYFDRALAMYIKTRPYLHSNTAYILTSIGLLSQMKSDFDQALIFLNKAEDIFAKLALPETHQYRHRANQAIRRIEETKMSNEHLQ
jgi:tetratricopeptide (TPR) repeat protein